MDRSRFAAGTRRRFTLAIGGLGAALAGLMARGDEAAAKKGKKGKKRRCKKLGQSCVQGAKGKRRCCKGHLCVPESMTTFACCRNAGQPCAGNDDCCSSACFEGSCIIT